MPPDMKDRVVLANEEATASKQPPTCEELYGPYPPAMPVPFLDSTNEGREGTTPSQTVLQQAKSMFDLPCDYRDAQSPDAWLPRDGRLVRLTGRHPFNVEPPTAVLDQYKFITPCSLHYVRNHGACPQLEWDTHTVSIGGNVSTPKTYSMDDLVALPSRELPVTLVCAGNRRKEQNMVRPTNIQRKYPLTRLL